MNELSELMDDQQGDYVEEVFGEANHLDPDLVEALDLGQSHLGLAVLDEVAVREAGFEFDDPELITVLQGAIDDPDGSGPAIRESAD